MLSLQEISDRLEIQDLLSRYSYAIDERDWDALDDIFTLDATIDYSETGGAKGSVAEIKAWLPVVMAQFPRYQHMVATTKLDLSGDNARSRTVLFNPMVYRKEDGEEQIFFIGLWYRDYLVRTNQGWRIAERYEEIGYAHNVPVMPAIPSIADVAAS
ncbi:nuclear transport factor 2 family protein [Sphingobium sp.]|uniref:nuclear transport factor 2 family protein n=1 Tax=Sphingobium sp. TaxID=1912891 RepID=UPI002CC0E2A6|nr:nuclear transport factor 2 family protein [Sphingobium sp.]HUD94931.1 nuclear transport factor 2 family protein [Sphingobium sp.]